MKATVKKDEEEQEISREELYDFSEENDYDQYLKEEEERRKPYEDIIQYIRDTPKLSLFNKDAKGNEIGNPLTVDTMLNWEQNHGSIYMSKVGDEPQIYIWRALRRFEYLRALRSDGDNAAVDWNNDIQRQKFIANSCLLYPSPSFDFLNISNAGILSTLETQILYKSGFVPDREAIQTISVIG